MILLQILVLQKKLVVLAIFENLPVVSLIIKPSGAFHSAHEINKNPKEFYY